MTENEVEYGEHDELTETVRDRVKDSLDHLKHWHEEVGELYDMVAGRQFNSEELAFLEEILREPVTFNRMSPVIDSVLGHQINNRQEARFYPREQGDIKVSELLTGAAQWADDECDAEDEITDAFWDMIVTGIGWTDTYMSYDEEVEGKLITAERIPVKEMTWDQHARKRNLSDARWVARMRWINRKDAESRWPKLQDHALGEALLDERGGVEGVVHDASRAWMYEEDYSNWYDPKEDQVQVVQYQWWELEPVYVLGDPRTGKLVELSESRFNRAMEVIEDGYARIKGTTEGLPIRYVRQVKRHYYQAFLTGPILLQKGDCPCPHSFTLRAMTAKRDENMNHWYGLGRVMRDPQKWSNKFFMDILDLFSSNRRGGAFVEEDALVNPRQAEEDWNSGNPLIMLRQGSLAEGRVLERQPMQYPQGLDRMMEWAIRAIPDTTGVNLEMMGMVDRNQPGILEAQRKRAAMSIIAILFSALRRYHKERGRVVLHFIKEYLSDGRLVRITGENGDPQYIPLIRQDGVDQYDIIVDEAPTSTNQREENWAMLQQLLPHFLEMGFTPPPELLDHIPLPSVLIDKWKRSIQESQQKREPIEQAQLQAEIRQATAEASETESKARETDTQAVLNVVKAMSEQSQMQNEQIKTLTERVQTISEILERATPTPEPTTEPREAEDGGK